MKIALIGYGKMGKEIERIAVERGHEIVSIIDIDNSGDIESEAFATADAAIEFTAPGVAYENCKRAMAAGVKVVSGSTGWMQQHGEEMKALCEKEGKTLFWSSNFSLGVAIFSAVNRYLAKIMNSYPGYSVEMTETHHIHKLDAPSGTAITLAEGILAELDRKSSWTMGDLTNPDGSVTEAPAETAEQLRINAIRRDEVPGIHTVRYDSVADSITITHDAKNRSGFALGAVLAAEFVKDNSGFLGMKDLFKF
ncbi:MAG: 4-hydroxy-tetrahydrodipicolinate reductase [Bacteroidales bacterium]|nr:4-hydroxy-tetrahydrodipicolinate reductase [Bacteroidales bacterium]MBR2607048.1 4-hydroxy-tetrahydrodipicolinate reductase [Bacteroidaceae bacterium]